MTPETAKLANVNPKGWSHTNLQDAAPQFADCCETKLGFPDVALVNVKSYVFLSRGVSLIQMYIVYAPSKSSHLPKCIDSNSTTD